MDPQSLTSEIGGGEKSAAAPKFFGIRGRLIFLVLVAAGPLLALIVFAAKQRIDSEQATELERAHMRSRLIAADLDQQVRSIETMLDGLARYVSVEPELIGKNDAVLRAIAAGLPPLFVNLELRGLEGEALGTVVSGAAANARDLKYFREALESRAFAVGEPIWWEEKNLWTLTFGRPVTDLAGRMVGVVGATIDLVELHSFLDLAGLPEGTLISLIDDTRMIITRASTPELGIGNRRPPEPSLDYALAQREGSRDFVSADSTRRIAGFSTCTRAPWLVYVRVPRALAFAAAEREFRQALTFGGVTLALTLALAWIIGSRITGPLRQLAAETVALGAGGRLQPSRIKSGGEVGRLADVFNHMLARLEERDGELRQLNETLRRRVDELQTLFDLLPVGIGIAVDATGREIRMNRMLSEMFGLPPGRNASLTAPADEAPSNYRVRREGRELAVHELPIQRAIAENVAVKDFEHTIVRNDGVEIDVLLNAVPLHDNEGRVRGCVATFQDLTAHKHAEKERLAFERKLRETQKLESLGVLAGGIAHDFNNILTGILGHASLASIDLPANSPVQDNLTSIQEGAVRAADLCKQMLAYSGKGRFVVQKLDLNHFVEETTHLLKISISKRAVLRFNLHPGLPPIEADATQIRQVIMNLVINASEAIGDKSGVISINTGLTRVDRAYLGGTLLAPELPEGNYVYLEVSDNGCGMNADTQAKIFEPFFTTKFSGRGLGLAAVLGIVRGHKGALKVYSEVGRGTTFKLLFPCAAGDADLLAIPAVPRQSWRGSGHVLIVDDEESVRTTAALMLRRMGFEVALVTDGREAVDAFRAEPARYKLVLMDLTMPHLDGEQAFNELRRLKPDVRVVLMSGFNEQEAVSRFTGKGLAGFVQKPFQFDTLSTAVREAVDGRK